ncbi:hypothetical protein KJ693_02065 [bacterium]|nr:hypothetical protein [bacterium]MBU1614076.1 hypothetical protein [bacterium]
MLKKVLAFASLICPVCNIARIFPGSKFARMMQQREENCPACKAYQEVFCKKKEKDER